MADTATDEVVYLDHNATTPVADEVLEAMLPFLREHYGNPSSDHALGHRARRAVDEAREQVAALIGAEADEVVFTSGGTEASNLAILGSTAHAPHDRRRIVTTAVEHPATVEPCARRERQGWSVTRVPVTADGIVEPAVLEESLGSDVALMTVILAQNETGALMPVAQGAGAACGFDIITHADAAQAVGKVPVRVADLGVDLLSIAGHKLYAPKGVGALFIRRGTRLDPVLLGAGQERGLRPGTENVASIVALGAACQLAQRGMDEHVATVAALRDRLWRSLAEQVPGLVRHTPVDSLPNTLSLSFPSGLGADILARSTGLAASTGSACHAGQHTPSLVLLAMGVDPQVALRSVRLSLGRRTTLADVDRAVQILAAAARA